MRQVFAYGFRDLLDETAHWLVLGIVLAALVAVLLPPSLIERYFGGGFLTMLAHAPHRDPDLHVRLGLYSYRRRPRPEGPEPGRGAGVPAGGAGHEHRAIVVLLKFLGGRVVTIYLVSIAIVALAAGYAVDWIYCTWQINPVATFGTAAGLRAGAGEGRIRGAAAGFAPAKPLAYAQCPRSGRACVTGSLR